MQDAANEQLHSLSLLSTGEVFGPPSDDSNEETLGSPSPSPSLSLFLFRLLGCRQGRRIFYAVLHYNRRWLQGRGHVLTGRTVFAAQLQRDNRFAVDYSRFRFCLRS